MKKISSILLLAALMGCSNNADPVKTGTNTMMAPKADSAAMAKPKYTADMVVNKKDFACGMPISAGLEDTCHYKGKAYGFCSKECKDEFLKDPEKMLAAAK